MKSIAVRLHRWVKVACVSAAGVGAALGLGGCSESRVFTYSLASPAGGVGVLGPAVDIENDLGSVEVRVEKWREDVAIEMKTHIPGEMTGDSRTAYAESFERVAEITESDGPAVVTIRNLAPDRQTRYPTRIVVRAPDCGGVRIRNAGGDVLVVGAAGAMQIENIDGDVEVRTDKPIDAPTLLTTTKGDVIWQVPTSSRGLVEAHTLDGKVTLDNWAKGQNDWTATWIGERKVSATMNGGENGVTLHTADGDIKILLLKDPMSRAAIFR